MKDDRALAVLCANGDREAFDELARRYRDRVYTLAFRMLGSASQAEDLTQDALMRAYTRLAMYDPERPFGVWLLNLTARLCLNAIRDRKSDIAKVERYGKAWRPETGVDERVEQRERERTLQRLLLRLQPDHRAAALLRYWEGLDVAEVAQALNAPVGTIKTWLFRARENLRIWLKEEGWQE
ncbi:MAG: sigma-70 family RNA polymerase sigma factor [Armatimonadetes bacterium]|nr:sigma-70 family RNA polymerase sigma factor [Armatimonadota bacterium]